MAVTNQPFQNFEQPIAIFILNILLATVVQSRATHFETQQKLV